MARCWDLIDVGWSLVMKNWCHCSLFDCWRLDECPQWAGNFGLDIDKWCDTRLIGVSFVIMTFYYWSCSLFDLVILRIWSSGCWWFNPFEIWDMRVFWCSDVCVGYIMDSCRHVIIWCDEYGSSGCGCVYIWNDQCSMIWGYWLKWLDGNNDVMNANAMW